MIPKTKSHPLLTLKRYYLLYVPLWEQWATYKFNGLTEEDVYLVNAHILTNFSTHSNDVMFYNKPDKIKSVCEKLKSNYPTFQEKIVNKFQVYLINLSAPENLTSFLNTLIADLNISAELKSKLLIFNCKTVSELILTYSDKDFYSNRFFKSILEFVVLMNEHKIFSNHLFFNLNSNK
jgi:hypothetical protein